MTNNNKPKLRDRKLNCDGMHKDTMRRRNRSSTTTATKEKLEKKNATDTNIMSFQPCVVDDALSNKSILNILCSTQEEDNNITNNSQDAPEEVLT